MSDVAMGYGASHSEKTMYDANFGYDLPQEEGSFEYASTIMDEMAAQKEKDVKFLRTIKIIITIVLGCALLEVVFLKFVIPSITVPLVSVTGQQSYKAEEIVQLLRPMGFSNWFKFDTQKAVAIISSASGIDSVTIKKMFPNKVYISITERTPVATTFINQGQKSIPLQIDKNGVLFSERKSLQNTATPIISGLPINHLSEGMRIPEKFRLLIDQIATIERSSQKYFSAISEICVVPKEFGNYELIIIPTKSKIRVITDRNLTEDSLKYMMIALDVITKLDKDASQINIREGVVSYIK